MSGGFHRYRDNGKTASSTSSTSKSKNKVHNLLRELESEFDKMLVENTALKSRIQLLEEGPTNDDEPSRTVGAGKDREAFRTLVESLVQMTTFISRIFLKLVELQKLIRLFC